MPLRLFVTRRLPDQAMQHLRDLADLDEIRVNPHDRPCTPAELREGFRWAHIVVTQLADNIDRQLLQLDPDLQMICNYGVGYNNIDVAAASEQGIPVTNTPDVLTETSADLTWALLMATARRIAEGDRFMRAGRFDGWAPELLLGQDIHGKTLGVVGMGRIGSAVARRTRGFDMEVLYHARRPVAEAVALDARLVDLNTLLQGSDFVSLHVPLTDATRHLIDEPQLRMMRPTAILVNASRGPVVNETSLVRALSEGWIAGAGLDVYEREPQMAPGLAELDNVVLAPHLGTASQETRVRMGAMIADNIKARLAGQRPPQCVNPQVL